MERSTWTLKTIVHLFIYEEIYLEIENYGAINLDSRNYEDAFPIFFVFTRDRTEQIVAC